MSLYGHLGADIICWIGAPRIIAKRRRVARGKLIPYFECRVNGGSARVLEASRIPNRETRRIAIVFPSDVAGVGVERDAVQFLGYSVLMIFQDVVSDPFNVLHSPGLSLCTSTSRQKTLSELFSTSQRSLPSLENAIPTAFLKPHARVSPWVHA